MKKIIVIFFIVLFFINNLSFGQDWHIEMLIEDLKLFLSNPTYIVLDDDSTEYNEMIKYAMEKYWNINKYEFICYSKYKELKTDEKNCFLRVYSFSSWIDLGSYMTLLANKGNFGIVSYADKGNSINTIGPSITLFELIHLPIKYQIIYAIKKINKSIKDDIGLYIEKNEQISKKEKEKEKLKILKSNIILISENDLNDDVNSYEKIKNYYQNKVKIVSDEDLYKAIDSKDSTIIFCVASRKETFDFKQSTGYSYRYIMDSNSGMILYSSSRNYSFNPYGFTKKDFKELQKRISKLK